MCQSVKPLRQCFGFNVGFWRRFRCRWWRRSKFRDRSVQPSRINSVNSSNFYALRDNYRCWDSRDLKFFSNFIDIFCLTARERRLLFKSSIDSSDISNIINLRSLLRRKTQDWTFPADELAGEHLWSGLLVYIAQPSPPRNAQQENLSLNYQILRRSWCRQRLTPSFWWDKAEFYIKQNPMFRGTKQRYSLRPNK